MKNKKVNYKSFLKIGLSVVLLWAVYRKVDFHNLLDQLSQISLPILLLLLVLYTIGQLMSVRKWQVFIDEAGLTPNKKTVLRSYFMGMFVNNFGLGTVGGDVARSALIRPTKGKRAASFATVVADRIHGLATLLSIGAVSILIVKPAVLGGKAELLSLLCIFAMILGWWLGPIMLKKIFPKGHKYEEAAIYVASAFPHKAKPMITATIISVLFHSLQIYIVYLISKELNTGLTLSYLFATIPIVNAASALPISINGIGVREALYVALFSPVGLSNETAVAFGAVWILVVTIVSALGGLLFLGQFSEMKSKIETAEAN